MRWETYRHIVTAGRNVMGTISQEVCGYVQKLKKAVTSLKTFNLV